MEATVVLPSHPATMEGSSECRLAPRVWCLCVRAWPREVPTTGSPQPQRRNGGGPRTRAHRTRASSPGPRLGSECGASNWPTAQPQYCHLCAHPCKSPEDCPPPRLPSGESLCQPWNGEVGPGPSTSAAPSPHPGQISSSGCGPYLTLMPSQLQPAPLSRFLHIAGMCVRWRPFRSAFASRGCGSRLPAPPAVS